MCRYSALAINDYISMKENVLEFAGKAYQQSQETEVIIFVPIFAAMIAEIYIRMKMQKEAEPFLNHAVNVIDRIQGTFTSVFAYFIIARCYLLMGKFEEGKTICENGMKQAEGRKLTTIYKILQELLYEFNLNLPNPNLDEIEKMLIDSNKEFEEKELLPFSAYCHVALAKLYEKKQNATEQEKHMQSAKKLFDQMGIKIEKIL